MSMEIYVLSDKRLSSMDEWQKAIDAEDFGLRLSADRSFEALSGHLPAWWKAKRAGFECDHWGAHELMDECPEIDFRRRWTYALAFRWGADLNACQGANMAATAYAQATDGVVFDPEAGTILNPADAAARVREMERLLPSIEEAIRNLTRQVTPKSGL
jgi:hypothetical protein